MSQNSTLAAYPLLKQFLTLPQLYVSPLKKCNNINAVPLRVSTQASISHAILRPQRLHAVTFKLSVHSIVLICVLITACPRKGD